MKKRIGWKKATVRYGFSSYQAIVKLEILGRVVCPDQKVYLWMIRGSKFVPKYRTSKAKVLDVYPMKKSLKLLREDGFEINDCQKFNGKLVAYASGDYKYYKGKICVPEQKFDDDKSNGCSSGIHFFKRKCEAQAW